MLCSVTTLTCLISDLHLENDLRIPDSSQEQDDQVEPPVISSFKLRGFKDRFVRMNTLCLITSGKRAADLDLFTIPLPKLYTMASTASTPTPPLSRSSSSSTIRPPSRSSTSSRSSTPKRTYSSSWYNQDENPSLEDIARQLETLPKRFERWQNVCATNVVMALFSPTPAVLFLFHPMTWVMFVLLGLVWLTASRAVS